MILEIKALVVTIPLALYFFLHPNEENLGNNTLEWQTVNISENSTPQSNLLLLRYCTQILDQTSVLCFMLKVHDNDKKQPIRSCTGSSRISSITGNETYFCSDFIKTLKKSNSCSPTPQRKALEFVVFSNYLKESVFAKPRKLPIFLLGFIPIVILLVVLFGFFSIIIASGIRNANVTTTKHRQLLQDQARRRLFGYHENHEEMEERKNKEKREKEAINLCQTQQLLINVISSLKSSETNETIRLNEWLSCPD